MCEHDDELARRFEGHRAHLRAVAYRLLGSPDEADDAVQETWLRLARSDASEVRNLGGWLTTVVGRICLDMLRARRTRREDELGELEPRGGDDGDPELDVLLAESVGAALDIVLDALSPAERLAFVLHDVFGVPFDEIATIVGRSPAATKMLASRARRRVRASDVPDNQAPQHNEVVAAFLAAARAGDFDGLLELLAPGVALRPDAVTLGTGVFAAEAGAPRVARAFTGRARGVTPARIDGLAGWAWAPGGDVKGAFLFTVVDGRIAAIDIVGDPGALARLRIELAPL
ncbi:sigma-70 family RNA polymerase sigma factor [Dactylosporangium darangshiense]|uniref:Sigma-70 family RNA polymerase sigma factor n=1 Tax=Dactylosporangium darangshiense TaxID=579108 RepID=A0ABP8DJV7_9ACTN